jgi:outer membrane protein assembly factor BamE
MHAKKIFIVTFLTICLTNCLSYDFSRRIVQQGNLLPQSKINQLHPGMSKNDVANLMGTSLVSPMFNEQRWDYAFTNRKGSGTLYIKHISLYFNNDSLTRIEQSTHQ